MSVLSKDVFDPLKAWIASITNATLTHLATSAMDAPTKASITSSLQSTATAVVQALEGQPATVAGPTGSVTTDLSGMATSALESVESGVGAVAESTADAAIEEATGPFAPAAVALANSLLSTVGGDIEAAINSLVHVKTQAAASPL